MSSKSTTHKDHGGRHPAHVKHKERLTDRVVLVVVVIMILLIAGFLFRALFM